MTLTRVQKVPGKAAAESGAVILDGPDGVAITFSADAAEETGNRLKAASRTARKNSGPKIDRGQD